QNFGSYASHPDTNEYSSYVQDTVRVTDHLALNLGARYDLQTFATKGLVSNPLWPDSGKVPMNPQMWVRGWASPMQQAVSVRSSFVAATAGSTPEFLRSTPLRSPPIMESPACIYF